MQPTTHRSLSRTQALRRSGHRSFSSFFDHHLPYRLTAARRAMVFESISKPQWFAGAMVVFATALAMVFVPQMASAMRTLPTELIEANLSTVELELPAAVESDAIEVAVEDLARSPAELSFAAEADEGWEILEVQRGQTLGQLFARVGLGAAAVHQFVQTSDETRALVRIHPGDRMAFRRCEAGEVNTVVFDRGEDQRFVLTKVDSAWQQEKLERHVEIRIQYASATINSSLFGDGARAGLSDSLILQMANAFAYDIDFALDLRRGDQFAVIYEEVYRDGEKLRDGDVIAASFVNRDKRHLAVRFVDEDGRADFYSEDGRSLRRAFLRTPLEFTRISSRFSNSRQHPILGRMRAHRGVDYAAPTGTPVRAAGDGRVTFRGSQRGYGNTIILQHTENRETLYAHLSRFAPNLRNGQRVRQGQTIGYVGMTGLATGPHLHYEFRIAGAHRDPLTVPLPKSEPLVGQQLVAFQSMVSPLVGRLEALEGFAVAANNR